MEEIAKLIENVLVYAEKELYLSAEGKVFARNRLLELLQVEPNECKGEYPTDIREVLAEITDYAVQNGICEEENAEKFADKIMDMVMPTQDGAVRLWQGVHRDEGNLASLYFFRDLVKNSLYIQSRPSVGWMAEDIVVMIPEFDKTEEEGDYPRCTHCIENIGFCGFPGERSQYTRRVLPVELDGEKWYFSFEREPLIPEEFCVSCGVHRASGDGRILPRMMDFIEQFPSVFCCTFPENVPHDRFFGGKKVLPVLSRYTAEKLWEKNDTTVYRTDWRFPSLRIEGKDKKNVTSVAQTLVRVWKNYETGNQIYVAVSFHEGFIVDLVQAKSPSSVFAPSQAYFPFGLFVLSSDLQEDISALIAEFTKEKVDFEKINADPLLGKYLETVIQLAAVHGARLSKEKAREILLHAINDACLQEALRNQKEESYFRKIVSEALSSLL